jgi:hypothetical protein
MISIENQQPLIYANSRKTPESVQARQRTFPQSPEH